MSKKTVDHLNILPHSLSAISNNLDISSASFTGIFQQRRQKDDLGQYKIKVKRPYQFAYKNPHQQSNSHIKNIYQKAGNQQYQLSDNSQQQNQIRIQAQQIPLVQNITGYQICKNSFSQQQIIEAFKVIDINKDDLITQEDIIFFLEYIKQPYTKEQIHQMIQMVSSDKKKVTFDDFKQLGKGTIIPFADIKIPDPNLHQKKKIHQNIKQNIHLYQENPSLLVNASKNDIISLKKFQQSKKTSKVAEFQSIKIIQQEQKLNFLAQQIKLLTQEQFNSRKQLFNSIQMVNINQVIRNYNEIFSRIQSKDHHKYFTLKQIAKVFQISQKQAKTIYSDKNNVLAKKIAIQAIVYSPLNKIKKLELGMMIMFDKKTINFNELYFLIQLTKGKDKSSSLKKKLLTVFKSKYISEEQDIDKLYALQLMSNYSFNFNF